MRVITIYGYVRVSTKGQAKDGYSLEQQEKEIVSKYENAAIHREAYSASSRDRPIFNVIMTLLENNDILVVTKLDRLARSTVEGIEIVRELFNRGVSVHVLNVGLLEDTVMGKFFLTTLLAVAEMERNLIVERTQAGKAIAKTKNGYKDGRPKKFTDVQLEFAVKLLETHSYTEVERMTKISKSTISRARRKVYANDL